MKNPWVSIRKPVRNFSVIRVSGNHPLSLFWGRDTQGRYLFIYEMSVDYIPERRKLPKLEGIQTFVTRQNDKAHLALVLNDIENWEIFFSLCTDLIRATSKLDNNKKSSNVLLRRLNRWQDFLKRKRPGLLSPEATKGLIGELLYLEEILAPRFSWDQSITFWKGPEGAPQDFAVHDTAIEVKCQAGGSKPTVNITSAEQLLPQLPDGYLVVFTISSADPNDDDSFSLYGLVERIRDSLETSCETTRERFDELLFLYGYEMREEYNELKYKRIAMKCYHLCDDFPRIHQDCIPPGVDHVNYKLSLEACKPFESLPQWKEPDNG